jgi:hypothetical protein
LRKPREETVLNRHRFGCCHAIKREHKGAQNPKFSNGIPDLPMPLLANLIEGFTFSHLHFIPNFN